MKLVFTSYVTQWPKSIDCRSGLHQESKERLWLTRERKVSFCHSRKEQGGLKSPWQSGDTHQGSPSITDRGIIAPHTQQLEVLWKSVKECAHGMETLSSVEMEVKFKITLMRPSSRSWLCSFILKGLIQDLFLLLKDSLRLSRVNGVPLCSPLSVLWICVVCSLHPRMMDPRDNTFKFNCSRGSQNNMRALSPRG